jgi:hypothetical protein
VKAVNEVKEIGLSATPVARSAIVNRDRKSGDGLLLAETSRSA